MVDQDLSSFTILNHHLTRTFLTTFLIFFLGFSTVYGQKFLALEKLGKTNRTTYYPGEEITYKNLSEEFERTDALIDLDFEKKLVIFRFDTMSISDFDYIRITPKGGVFSPYTGLTIAVVGGAFFLIDMFNRAVVQGQPYTFDESTAQISLIIVGTGLLIYSFKKTKFKPKRNKRIRIVDLSPG